MTVCLLIGGTLILFNAGLATAVWLVLAKRMARARLARAGGALLGAAVGAWAVAPELSYLTDWTCEHFPFASMCNASLPVPVFYVYPFALPPTAALSAWLFAELLGGRTLKPRFTLGWTVAGALLGAAAVFLPLFFHPYALDVLPRLLREPALVVVPPLGALLAFAVAERRVASLGEAGAVGSFASELTPTGRRPVGRT